MLNSDIQHIASCLSGVLSRDTNTREQAQNTLLELEKKSGYAPCLVQLICLRNELPHEVRLGGSLRLKELAKYSWWGKKEHVLSNADRQAICSELINMIVYETDHKIRAQLIEVLFHVLRASFPKEWPGAFDQINTALNNAQSPEVLLGATWCFNTICRVFRYASHKSDREYMKTFVEACMPKLLSTLQNTYKEQTPLALEFTKLVLKTFNYSIQISIPSFYTFPVLDTCVALFLSIAQSPIDQAVEHTLRTVHNEISTNIHVKIRKWALKNLYVLLNKSSHDKFSKEFFKRYGNAIVNTIVTIVNMQKAGRVVPPKVWLQCFQILRLALLKANLYTSVIKPNMKDFLEIGVYNALCYTPKDVEDWTSDPYGFVAQTLDPMSSMTDHRYAAERFLTNAGKSRHKTVLPIVLNLAKNIFDTYQANEPGSQQSLVLAKDTILRMFTCLKKPLIEHNPQIAEQIILEHIFPEFKRVNIQRDDIPPILAVRGLAFISAFSECKFTNQDILLEATKFACSCLGAADIALRVEAGQTLGKLVSNDSIRDALKPNLGFLFQQLLTLIKEISNETLAALFHDLITYFENDLHPYAEAIVRELVPLFMANTTNQQCDEDEEQELILSSMQYLSSIGTIIAAVGTSEQLLPVLERLCDPIIKIVLENQELDYLDGVLHLFQFFTYFPKHISEYSWSYLPAIVNAVTTWAPDYMEHFSGPLVNYFSNNIDDFYARPDAVQLILSVAQHFLAITDLDLEAAHAANVLRTLIGYSTKGQLNDIYPQIMELLFPILLNNDRKLQLRLTCLDALCAMLHNNIELFFYLLGSRNTMDTFVNVWFSLIPSIKTERRATCSIHALCKIFEALAIQQMPDCFRQQIPVVLGKLMEAMLQVKEAAEREESDGEYDSEPDLFDVPSDYDDEAITTDSVAKEAATIEKIQKYAEREARYDDPDRTEFGSSFEIYTTPIDDINPFTRFIQVFNSFREADAVNNKYTDFLQSITAPTSPALALFTFAQEAAIRFDQDSDED